jgi:hypothetical protein
VSNVNLKRLDDRRVKLERLSPRWEPKEWQPEYDEMVVLTCHGVSNIRIAEQYNLTPQQVSNILNTDQGKLKIAETRKKHLEKLSESVGGRLENISIRAVGVIEEVLTDEAAMHGLRKESPLSLLSSMMGILKATGKVKDSTDRSLGITSPANVTINQNNIQVNSNTNIVTVPIAIAERVNTGLGMLQEIDRIHGQVTNVNSESNTSKPK